MVRVVLTCILMVGLFERVATQTRCKLCKEEFSHPEYLKAHRCRGEKRRSIACPECGKLFSSATFSKHKYTHEDTRPHKCENCGKKFKLLTHLQRHGQTCYDLPKKYQCRYCDERFRSFSPELIRHERLVHLKVKPTQCPVCFHNWTDARNMRRHLRMHTQEKPHQCSFCDKTFTRIDNKNVHERNVHGKEKKTKKKPRIDKKSERGNSHVPEIIRQPDDIITAPDESFV
mmetsp:Transcript_7637/g.14955  ORF Transcript_7637/g.14955 Transcript_7637/m.14955 type:complete len:230 (-) Transcript_7637:170-859(-)